MSKRYYVQWEEFAAPWGAWCVHDRDYDLGDPGSEIFKTKEEAERRAEEKNKSVVENE